MRLSRDDERAGESLSIESQRIILRGFVSERNGTVIEEYVDDGWSGTNFDRPAVARMLDDARSGRIDTIIVKDLSRFGRNYIQVGQYIDYIFPAYGIRFIAISDNLDTADRSSAAMDMMPIMNVFNEWHAASTSKKIRSALQASRRSGKNTNWSYPYGYKAGGDGKRTAVVDECAAATVRRIFGMRSEGVSLMQIARTLTNEGIPNPATYYTKADGGKIIKNFSPFWSARTVSRILSDPVYVGTSIQYKTTTVSYKNRKIVKIPKEEQIIRENAHEAIISREEWERVQKLKNCVSRGRADKFDRVHALSGLVVCADCGKKLKLKRAPTGYFFSCRTYCDYGRKYCTSHVISENVLEDIVLRDLRSQLSIPAFDGRAEREKFIKRAAERNEAELRSAAIKRGERLSRLGEINKLLQSLYEEKVLHGLPDGVFGELLQKYTTEKNNLERELKEPYKKEGEGDVEKRADEYVLLLKRRLGCEVLTRELCLRLIDFIEIGERVEDSRSIHIYYKFR